MAPSEEHSDNAIAGPRSPVRTERAAPCAGQLSKVRLLDDETLSVWHQSPNSTAGWMSHRQEPTAISLSLDVTDMPDNPWDAISWITDKLALSSRAPAQDAGIISDNGFRTIISIGESKAVEGNGWQVLSFRDVGVDHIYEALLSAVIAAIFDALKRGKTLVHCTAGVSRSAGVVTLYVAVSQGLKWSEALAIVQERRPVVDIGDGMAETLDLWLRRQRGGS